MKGNINADNLISNLFYKQIKLTQTLIHNSSVEVFHKVFSDNVLAPKKLSIIDFIDNILISR